MKKLLSILLVAFALSGRSQTSVQRNQFWPYGWHAFDTNGIGIQTDIYGNAYFGGPSLFPINFGGFASPSSGGALYFNATNSASHWVATGPTVSGIAFLNTGVAIFVFPATNGQFVENFVNPTNFVAEWTTNGFSQYPFQSHGTPSLQTLNGGGNRLLAGRASTLPISSGQNEVASLIQDATLVTNRLGTTTNSGFLTVAGQIASPTNALTGMQPYMRGAGNFGGPASELGRFILTNAIPLTNSYTDLYRKQFGEEYLLPWQHYVLTNHTSTAAEVFLLGDSTIFGAETQTTNLPYYLLCNTLLSNFANADQVPNVNFFNFGSNGVTSSYFVSTAASAATNAATADGGISTLIVLGYGANDSGAFTQPDYGASQSYTNIMTGIGIIRSALPNASIIWKMPNSMSWDPGVKCEQAWEYYRPWYAWGSRQSAAAFYDTYGMYSDARTIYATNWMDNIGGSGNLPTAVHPTILNWLIWRDIYEMMLPRGLTYQFAQTNTTLGGNLTVNGNATFNAVTITNGLGVTGQNINVVNGEITASAGTSLFNSFGTLDHKFAVDVGVFGVSLASTYPFGWSGSTNAFTNIQTAFWYPSNGVVSLGGSSPNSESGTLKLSTIIATNATFGSVFITNGLGVTGQNINVVNGEITASAGISKFNAFQTIANDFAVDVGVFGAVAGNTSVIGWAGSDNATTNVETGFWHPSPGVVSLGNLTPNDASGTLRLAGLQLTHGSNRRSGTAVLSGGTVVVANTTVSAGDYAMIGYVTAATSMGALAAPVSTFTNGSAFVINSYTPATAALNTLDTNIVWWVLYNQN